MAKKNKTVVTAEHGKQELFITREFEAPKELVFKAFTDPEMLTKWFLPIEHKMSIDYIDYRTGGSYRFILPDANGNGVGISGVVHEVLAPDRIIKTFEYEGLPERGHVALQKTLFEALPGERTKITIHYICESVAYRDGLVNSGMEKHNSACYDALDGLLEKYSQPV